MRKIIFTLLVFLVSGSGLIGQSTKVYEDSWSLGIGGTYPRFITLTGNSIAGNTNYGGYVTLRRSFSEHITLRFQTNYDHIETEYFSNGINNRQKMNLISGNLDFIYNVIPCEFVTPYVALGFGLTNFKVSNAPSPDLEGTHQGYQFNMGVGAEWHMNDKFSIKTEVNYHTSSDNKMDGNYSENEVKGILRSNGDTYMTFDIGGIWYFSVGDESDLCKDCPDGIKEVIKEVEVPVEVVKVIHDTVVVKPEPNWVLVGVNFEFDKSTLLPEAYPILEHSYETLKNNPDMKIEIQGHTDSKGSDEYNQKLSEQRAQAIYDYLIEEGIAPDRMITVGYGEQKPIADNSTEQGRAFNRRIEFKVLNK